MENTAIMGKYRKVMNIERAKYQLYNKNKCKKTCISSYALKEIVSEETNELP